jgi:hypothetical protein
VDFRSQYRAWAVARRKQPDSQSDLPFSRAPDTRTLEIRCGNCGVRFVASCGTGDNAGTETVDTDKSGLCGPNIATKAPMTATVALVIVTLHH